MRPEITPGSIPSRVLQQPPPLPETGEPDLSHCEFPVRLSAPPTEHDATLLVAALEQLEAQRAAIAWLRDADLLSLLLV